MTKSSIICDNNRLVPHKFHHAVHVNDFVMVSFENLCSRRTIVTEPRAIFLVLCPVAAHVENVWKIPGEKNVRLINVTFIVLSMEGVGGGGLAGVGGGGGWT